MKKRTITPNLHMADIINTWPETIPIFLGYRMICVGCYMSEFDTLADAMQIYNLPIEQIMDELNHIIEVNTTGQEKFDG
ncbi:MAG: DUF1858 domain-containing protein [Anaerolineales bacterium]|nr:DUF1858 domain-containing protein [Chloroflexota bacterium]MBL6982019.1 DUF1858 domain-containing protein [Anaerolineales bacterium]